MPQVAQPAREILRLAGFKGCILCGSKYDHIFWRPLVHCCGKCLQANLMTVRELWDNYALPASCFKHLPYHDVRSKTEKLKAYLYGDAVTVLQKYYGMNSFMEFRNKHDVENLKRQHELKRSKAAALQTAAVIAAYKRAQTVE